VKTAGLLFQRRSIRDAQSKWRVGAGPVTATWTLDIYSDALPELDESAADLLEAASISDAVGSAEA